MSQRMTFTPEEIANGRATTDERVREFLDLAAEGFMDPGYEQTYFNSLALELDSFFEGRAREVTGAGTTPLTELELIAEGLRGEGVLPELDDITYLPADSVIGLNVGDEIALTADQFVELSDAVFAELEAKFPGSVNAVAPGFTVVAVPGLPEIRPGDDLAELIGAATDGLLEAGDILVVTSKIVSKAEGRIVAATDREDAITSQTVRVVATREHPNGVTRIVENPQGLVLAAAGVDASNAIDGEVLLLPEDPDASARALCAALRVRTGLALGVILSDTLGRPWRVGQTDAAIGAAGVRVAADLRGTTDATGHLLEATVVATADEVASAAELVKGKASGLPVAIVRGLGELVGDLDLPGARTLVRSASEDMFRLGSTEAWTEGYEAGLHAARGES